MTIIITQAQNTCAMRRKDLSFRLDGGPLPPGKPRDLHIDTKDRGDQSITMESGLVLVHPTQASLAYSGDEPTTY